MQIGHIWISSFGSYSDMSYLDLRFEKQNTIVLHNTLQLGKKATVNIRESEISQD